MEPVKVLVENVTGSQKAVALLYPQSGLIKIGNSWTFLAHEMAFNKTVTDYVEPPVTIETIDNIAHVSISAGPSNKGKKKK